MQPWVVISFDDENTVATVPNSWLFKANRKDMCYWPSNSRNATGYVRRRDRPGSDWQKYPVTILGDYATYDIALRKAHKAEDTSELSSNNDTLKRKRTRSLKYLSTPTSSESDREDSETEYPKLPNVNKVKNKEKNNENVFPLSEMGSKSDHHSETTKNSQRDIAQETQQCITDQTPTSSFISICTPKSGVNDNDSNSIMDTIAPSEKEFRKQVLTKLNIIIAKLGRHDEVLENIDSLLASRSNAVEEDTPSNTGIEKLPVRNDDELAVLEQFICEGLHFRALAKELSRLGGQMVPEIMRKIMYRVISNEFAQLYSWEGGKGKRKFVNLTISRVIIDAVRCNKRTSNACDDEIISEVKRWLVKAKERVQNQNKRREKLADKQDEQNQEGNKTNIKL